MYWAAFAAQRRRVFRPDRATLLQPGLEHLIEHNFATAEPFQDIVNDFAVIQMFPTSALGCIRKNHLRMLRHPQHNHEDHKWNQDEGNIQQDPTAWLLADFPVCEFIAVSDSHMLLVFQIKGELPC